MKMKNFLASGTFIGAAVAVQMMTIFVIGFFSDPKEPTGIAFMFMLLCLSGAAIAIAGIVRLLVMGPQEIFGSLALFTMGGLGFVLGVAIQEVISGAASTPYAAFLFKYATSITLLICVLVIPHLITMSIVKKSKRIRAG